mgnify:CR=1 FL=1
MPTKLKIKIAKHPSPAAALAAKEIRPSRRMLRAIFSTRRPQHRMAVLLPGSEAFTVEVRVADTDDLMALANVAGVTREGGDNRLFRVECGWSGCWSGVAGRGRGP